MRKGLLSVVAFAGLAGAAWADHPERQQMEQVKAAAHQLERAAHHVHESAGRHDSYHALDELHHMDRHVRDDFRDVEAHMHTLMDYYGGRDHWDGRHRP